MAGQSVRAGREPFPAWNEGAAGHAGKTLLRKKYLGLHLDRSGYFFYTQYTLWGYAQAKKRITPKAELPGECFFIL